MGFMNSFWKLRRRFRNLTKKNEAPIAEGDRMVYFVKGGTCYHYYDACLDHSSKDISEIKEKKAIKIGLRLCKKCEKSFIEDGY